MLVCTLLIARVTRSALSEAFPSFFFLLPSPPRKNKFTDVDSSASQVLAYRGTSSRVLSYVYPAFNRRRRRRRYFTPLPSPSLSFSLRSLSRYLYGELRYSPESREQLSGRRHSYLLGRRRSGDLNDIRARARARVYAREKFRSASSLSTNFLNFQR